MSRVTAGTPIGLLQLHRQVALLFGPFALPCGNEAVVGFGFAVLEGPQTLIDWGTKQVKPVEERRCLDRVTQLTVRQLKRVAKVSRFDRLLRVRPDGSGTLLDDDDVVNLLDRCEFQVVRPNIAS